MEDRGRSYSGGRTALSTLINRLWDSYKRGFGSEFNFWLGNDKIHRLTASGSAVLLVELVDKTLAPFYYKYDKFFVENETNRYRLTAISGSGTSDYLLGRSNGMNFSTIDRVNSPQEDHFINCAKTRGGGWWYNLGCRSLDINGHYGKLFRFQFLGTRNYTLGKRIRVIKSVYENPKATISPVD